MTMMASLTSSLNLPSNLSTLDQLLTLTKIIMDKIQLVCLKFEAHNILFRVGGD